MGTDIYRGDEIDLCIHQHGIPNGVGYSIRVGDKSVDLSKYEMRDLAIKLNTFLLNQME
jgi:hypothetical protein